MREARWSNVYTTSSPERHSDGLAAPQNVIVSLLKITLFPPIVDGCELWIIIITIIMKMKIMMMMMTTMAMSTASSSSVGQWLKCPARILSSRHRLWWLISAIFLWTNINITASSRHRLEWLISTRGSFFPGYFGYFPPQVNLPIYPPSRQCSDTLFSLQKRGWFLLQS